MKWTLAGTWNCISSTGQQQKVKEKKRRPTPSASCRRVSFEANLKVPPSVAGQGLQLCEFCPVPRLCEKEALVPGTVRTDRCCRLEARPSRAFWGAPRPHAVRSSAAHPSTCLTPTRTPFPSSSPFFVLSTAPNKKQAMPAIGDKCWDGVVENSSGEHRQSSRGNPSPCRAGSHALLKCSLRPLGYHQC